VSPHLAPALALAIGVLATSGCGRVASSGDGATRDDGESTDELPDELPDIDLETWCGPAPSLDFTAHGSSGHVEELGPCGHLDVTTMDGRVLMSPDGGDDEPLGTSVTDLRFSPTGHLVAWAVPHTPVQLKDLRDDGPAFVSPDPVDSFGFVRTSDAELGARLWTCGDDGLALQDPAGTQVLSAAANCSGIVAAGSRARLVFGDARSGGTITAVDTDTGDLWPSEVHDFGHVGFPGLDERADILRISYDGRLAVHEVVTKIDDGAVGELVTSESRVIDLDSGEVIETCPFPNLIQAEHAGAPLWLRCSDFSFFHFDGALEEIGEIGSDMDLAAQTGAVVVELDQKVVRLGPDAPTQPELLADLTGTMRRPRASASGEAVAFIDDLTLVRWTETRGLDTLGVAASLDTGAFWGILALADDGQLLAYGQLEGDDQGRMFGMDPQGEITIFDTVDRQPWVYGVLADGRILAESRSGVDPITYSLVLLEPTDGEVSTLLDSIDAEIRFPFRGPDVARGRFVAVSVAGLDFYYGSVLP
jgi:hypothetical protein